MRQDGILGGCFMEPKRGAYDLEPALMANLHSASQALSNPARGGEQLGIGLSHCDVTNKANPWRLAEVRTRFRDRSDGITISESGQHISSIIRRYRRNRYESIAHRSRTSRSVSLKNGRSHEIGPERRAPMWWSADLYTRG
jgi:hypothetical protein